MGVRRSTEQRKAQGVPPGSSYFLKNKCRSEERPKQVLC